MALSNRDASIVLGMLARGDKNQDIAAWFGENPARIVEVEQGAFGSLVAAPADQLPPKGAVGPKGRRLRGHARDALEALAAGGGDGVGAAIKELREGLAQFDKDEA